jgi:glycerol-3-phosphate dehydrogenase
VQRDPSPLEGTHFDVAVIGGGICGAAAAWDAAQRGLSAVLLERGDFGEATSANSLKVVHGGIRYLQHVDIARVRESSRERSALLRVAPHLVEPMPVLVPAFGHGAQGPEALAAAFLVLNVLTADRNRGLDPEQSFLPPARLISRSQFLQRCPELDRRRLTGAGVFWDGRLLNPPRLVWTFVRTALEADCVAVNYCGVDALLRHGDRVVGVRVTDHLSSTPLEVRARVVINAAGPFAQQLLVRSGLPPDRETAWSRDMALVLSRRPSSGNAIALPTRYRDPDALLSRGPRHLFFVPWHDVTLVGVHSAIFSADPDSLLVGEEEVRQFVHEVNDAAPWLQLTLRDVAQVYSGLLPIGAGQLVNGNVSFGKRTQLTDHARTHGIHGLITAVTNRFTTARGLAARAVDLAVHKLGYKCPPCRTSVTPLVGTPDQKANELGREVIRRADVGLEYQDGERLARNYGTKAHEVLGLIREAPALAERLGPSGTLAAEVQYSTRHELAHRLADCVFRRTDIGTSGYPGDAALHRCADVMAAVLGWSSEQRERELVQVRSGFPYWS